jgi:hypothetical protein
MKDHAMSALRHAAAALALFALATPLAAQDRPQLSETEVNAVALYSMPHAFRALQTRCAAQLPADAYIRTQGDALGTRLDRASRGRFPAARAALTRLVTSENPQMATLLAQLPADNVEPLARELIAGKVQSEVNLSDCAKYNRVLELLDPLPPENLASLMGVLVVEAQASSTRSANSGNARR